MSCIRKNPQIRHKRRVNAWINSSCHIPRATPKDLGFSQHPFQNFVQFLRCCINIRLPPQANSIPWKTFYSFRCWYQTLGSHASPPYTPGTKLFLFISQPPEFHLLHCPGGCLEGWLKPAWRTDPCMTANSLPTLLVPKPRPVYIQ